MNNNLIASNLLLRYKKFNDEIGLNYESETLSLKELVDNGKLKYEDGNLIDKNNNIYVRLYKDYKNKYFDLKSNVGKEVVVDYFDDYSDKELFIDAIIDKYSLRRKLKRNVKEKIEIIRYNNDNKKDFFDLRDKISKDWYERKKEKYYKDNTIKYFEELLFKDFNENEYVIAGFYIKDEPVGLCVAYRENEYMSYSIESRMGNIEYIHIGEYINKYEFENVSTRFINIGDIININENLKRYKLETTNYILPYGFMSIKRKKGNITEWF